MKQRIINYLFHHLLNSLVLEDIIRSDKDNIYIDNKKIGAIELRSLIAEAKALEDMYLWKIINQKIKEESFDVGWRKSTTMTELNTAKTMLYTLDVQDSIIKVILSKEKK